MPAIETLVTSCIRDKELNGKFRPLKQMPLSTVSTVNHQFEKQNLENLRLAHFFRVKLTKNMNKKQATLRY